MVAGLMTKAEKVVGTGLSFQLLFPRPLFYFIFSKFYLVLFKEKKNSI